MVNELSYWEKTVFFNYDVMVVGSGIVGLNAAIEIKRALPTIKIAILEAGFLPTGASTKNAGFACFGSISELIEQEKICGTEGLVQLIGKRWNGLLKLRQLLGDKNLDYKALGGYEIFTKQQDYLANQAISKIEYYNKLIKPIIGADTFELKNEKIKSFGFNGIENIIYNKFEAQIDTGKMMYNLLQYAQQLGIVYFNNCSVKNIISENSGLKITTTAGDFYCKKTVVTTNAFVKDLFSELDVTPGRGQVLVTTPIKNLKIKGTFHYDSGYYYFRNIHNRLLIGGGRNLDFTAEETTNFGTTDQVQHKLEEIISTLILPKTSFEIDQRWSGIMAFGKSLEPIITEIKPNVFCAVRSNGMGVAIGSQIGADVASLLLKSI